MRTHPLWAALAAALVLSACGGSDPNRTPAAILALSGDNQTGAAGIPLQQPLIVQVDDKAGDPVSGVTVVFSVTAGGGSIQPASATTNSRGQATAIWTLGTLAGAPSTATASVNGLSGPPASFAATVQAALPASAVLLQGGGQTAVAGQPLAIPVVVEFKDAFNNPAVGQAVNWAVTGGAGSLTGTSVITDAQGRATTLWTLGYQLGSGHALQAQIGGAGVTATATATMPSGATLTVASGDGQFGLAGQSLNALMGVRVRASGGQDIANVPINWAVTAGGGSLSQPATASGPNGIATVGWTLGGVSGAQTITADNAALTPASLTLHATAIIPPPSAIIGTVSLVDSQLSAIRGPGAMRSAAPHASARSPFARAAEAPTRALGSGHSTTDFIPTELLVQFRRAAFAVQGGPRALANVAAARAAALGMQAQLRPYLVSGPARLAGVSPVIRTARLRFPSAGAADSMAHVLARDPAVEAVSYNARLRADGGPIHPGTLPNDPNFPNQSWHYDMVGLPAAWSTTTGSSNVIVAVLDNGIRFDHPGIGIAGGSALSGGGNLRNDGYDFVSSSAVSLCSSQGGGSIDNAADGGGYDPDPTIPDDRDAEASGCLGARSQFGAHGLHVAGTIGALGNDGVGVAGVNWTVSIRPVRVLGIDGGNYFDIAQGVLYASGLPASDSAGGVIAPPAAPARILNMSLGGGCPGAVDPLHDAIIAATDPLRPNGGVLIVASAGNSASSVASCPAFYNEVLAVGSVGPTGNRSSFSNFGGWVDIAAPGGETNAPDGTYGIFSTVCDFTVFPAPCTPGNARYFGTSMAAPHVAGVAALLLAQDPSLTPAQLRARLITYSTPIAPSQQIGPGIVNARAALAQSLSVTRSVRVRAVDAATGATVAEVAAPGGSYTLSGLPDGSYYVVAGEDDSGDGQIGLPDRRFGAFGGISSPAPVTVSGAAGAFAAFSIGYPVEQEPNDLPAAASLFMVGGTVQGSLTGADAVDFYRIVLPTSGIYTFETGGLFGNYCSFALDLNTVLQLADQSQNEVAISQDIAQAGNDYCSRISMSLPAGTYYLRVTPGDFFGTGPHTGRYLLTARSGP
jgi:serine protease